MLFNMDDTIIKSGQLYRVVGFKPYTKRDGTQIELVRFVSHCADCGQTFEFGLPQGANDFTPCRRCDKHKKPGVRVSKKSWVRNVMPFVAQENVFD